MEPVPETTAYEHIAYENLANSVLPCGYKVKFTRPNDEKYSVLNGHMDGAGTTAKLLKPHCFTISWTLPTERENGDSITLDELSLIELDIDGVIYPVKGLVTEYQIDTLSKGLHKIKIRITDTDGLIAGWSDPVEVTI